MPRVTMEELREQINELKIAEANLKTEKRQLTDGLSAAERDIQKLKAVAQHYRTQRDRIDAYLCGILDEGTSLEQKFPEVDTMAASAAAFGAPTEPQPILNPLRPQVTEPGKEAHDYGRTERIDWESF